MKALLRLHSCAFTLESPSVHIPNKYHYHMTGLFFCNIITIVIIHAVNHSYNLSFFSINIKNVQFISTHTVLKKGGDICFHLENKF